MHHNSTNDNLGNCIYTILFLLSQGRNTIFYRPSTQVKYTKKRKYNKEDIHSK